MAPFEPVAPQVRFPEVEERVLARWAQSNVFARSLEGRAGAPAYVMYEGPPTANGRPGVHHVLARVFKDIYPRFHAMRGRYVPRKGGWDCHGLPVELEIEKELGLSSKRDIEAYGIERFNAKCRESVQRYVEDWERLTERIGYWTDLSQAYWTMTNSYVESVWWSLRRIHDAGLLEEDYRSVAYCPRCGTALSDHEVALGYQTVTDPSVFVRFPLEDAERTSLLVWTTTPWTLLSNAAAAIHPEVTYVAVEHEGERLILAEPLVHRVLGADARAVEWFDAGSLEGRSYRPPYRYVEPDRRAWFVASAEFVTTDDGTGIVHIAPAFGAEDLEFGRQFGLPVIHLVDDEGRFKPEAKEWGGRFVKEADPDVIADLDRRGLLFRAEEIEHTYPLCWRCDTPLLYMAQTSWYIRTKARKDDLLAANERITWYPDHIKHGRFGDWLANNVDWALSRARYWGTPLPIWRCPQGHAACIGSVAELGERAGRDLSDLDLHRPYVDEIAFACGECGEQMRRVPDVIDAWYDSGSMPFAQWHHPFEDAETLEARYPADYICEAIDQTRGWFYSLLGVSTMLSVAGELTSAEPPSYRNVVCLGHIVDKNGRKMSKSLGNVLDPWDVLGTQGADALRWYLFTVGSPWTSRRVYPEAIDDVVRGFMRTVWSTYSFAVLYANADDVDPSKIDIPVAERAELDRWILAELHDTVRTVTEALEGYDCTGGGRRIAQLTDDLSNWYVRRSRRRFWKSADEADSRAAHRTLYECLTMLALLLAPYTPFLADELWSNLVRSVQPGAPDSVHLADWPEADESVIDEELRKSMATARRIVRTGLQLRERARIKVRQPLARCDVIGAELGESLTALIREELNVKDVTFAREPASIESSDHAPGDFAAIAEEGLTVGMDFRITPELRAEGWAREVVRGAQNLRKRSGLEVSDRISFWIDAPDEVWDALGPHRDYIAGEVLAREIGRGTGEDAAGEAEIKLDGASVKVSLRKS